MSNEITRETLDLLLGFQRIEPSDDHPYYRRRFEKEYFELFTVTDEDGNDTGTYESYKYSHINTLPELRQFIRSMYGDDALPRRELSSITDDELQHVFSLAIGDTDGIRMRRTDKKVWCGDGNKGFEIRLTDGALYQYIGGKHYDGQCMQVANYLINVCDFHIPAFHGERNA